MQDCSQCPALLPHDLAVVLLQHRQKASTVAWSRVSLLCHEEKSPLPGGRFGAWYVSSPAKTSLEGFPHPKFPLRDGETKDDTYDMAPALLCLSAARTSSQG